MKQILNILATFGLTATTGTSIIVGYPNHKTSEDWSLKTINEKVGHFWQTLKDLIQENEGTGYPYPGANPDLKEKWIKTNFEMVSFTAEAYLHTDYLFDHEKYDNPHFREAKNDLDYNEALESTIDGINEAIEEMQEKEEYIAVLQDYQIKLKELFKEVKER